MKWELYQEKLFWRLLLPGVNMREVKGEPGQHLGISGQAVHGSTLHIVPGHFLTFFCVLYDQNI